jgi:hypothetical protein
MLIWGSGGKSVDAGDAGNQACAVCKENRPFRYLLTYTLRHIWYLIRWSTGQRYYKVCGVCNNAFESEAPVVQSAGVDGGARPKSPIPLFDRWGWAMGLGVIGLLFAGIMVSANADRNADALLIAKPQKGDLYRVDMDKIAGPNEAKGALGKAYGIVRVAEVGAQTVILDVPKIVYNKFGGTFDDVRGPAKADAYYEGQMLKTVPDLVSLQASGTIQSVDR